MRCRLQFSSPCSPRWPLPFAIPGLPALRRKLLRRRIGAYLEAQTGLLPRTVIFAALLRSPPPPAPPHPAPHAPELDASERSSNSNSVASVDDSGPPSTSTSTSQAEGWTNRDSAVGAAQPPPDAAGHAARLRPAQWSETLLGTAEVRAAAHDRLSRRSCSVRLVQAVPLWWTARSHMLDHLLGGAAAAAAQVSFDRSTHSASLTLQPPRRAAYLCNMAVAGEWRRRGVGRHLIRAVEKVRRAQTRRLRHVAWRARPACVDPWRPPWLCTLWLQACEVACEDELYLHLRFQDQPAAKLYEAAGFDTAASDPWLVVLLGQDRKRLMRKRVPTEAAVGGASAGPASVQQQQHLEEEQRVRG